MTIIGITFPSTN